MDKPVHNPHFSRKGREKWGTRVFAYGVISTLFCSIRRIQ
jgi:hypothetical protein